MESFIMKLLKTLAFLLFLLLPFGCGLFTSENPTGEPETLEELEAALEKERLEEEAASNIQNTLDNAKSDIQSIEDSTKELAE